MNLQKLLSYTRRACDDYGMINENDKIAVGISGGKDSLSLLTALKKMQQFYPKKYDLEAVTVSIGLPGFDAEPISELCATLDINFTLVKTDIGQIVFNERKEQNPCSLCANMRRGALNNEAKKLGCNKVALGHNKDDVIETFLLSLFYEARINCFSPVTYLDRMEIYTIRPLLYVSEKEVRAFIEHSGMQVVKNPCYVDGRTKRQMIKEYIADQKKVFDNFDEKIFGAIQRSDINGWTKG